MFDFGEFEKSIKLLYFDIPSLHTFDEEGCRFFDRLAALQGNGISIFARRSIQILIVHKWQRVKTFIKYMMLAPHLVFLIIHVIWNINVRPFKRDM